VSHAIITLLQLNFQQQTGVGEMRAKEPTKKTVLHSANTIVNGIVIPCLEDMTIEFDKHQMKLEAQLTQVEGNFASFIR
jgi:ribosomal protein S3AE